MVIFLRNGSLFNVSCIKGIVNPKQSVTIELLTSYLCFTEDGYTDLEWHGGIINDSSFSCELS